MPKYKVQIHYSTFSTHEVEADNDQQAITLARGFPHDTDEYMDNMEEWTDADTAILIE